MPLPGRTITPINYGGGPALFTLNLRLSKTIGLGPKVEGTSGGPRSGGGGRASSEAVMAVEAAGARWAAGGGPFIFGSETSHKYNLTFSVSARNLLNNVNYAPPVGNLDSPFFGNVECLGRAPFSSGSASRRIDLQMLFSF